jgi:hypothetical protein
MILKKEMSIAVIFLAAAIIFVSSTPMANNAFAQTEGEEDIVQTELVDNSIQTGGEDNSGSKNYENFLDCLSNASASGIPASDEIMNCVEESGYIQGTSGATSSAADTADETENVPVSVVSDESDEDEDESDEDEDESDEDEDESDEDEDESDEDEDE